MKHFLVLMLVAMALLTTGAQGQESPASKRIANQHKIPKHMPDQLSKTEQNAVVTLKDGNLSAQCQALQNVRELEQMFPDYPFTKLLAPLEGIVKDQHADNKMRMLAALALDELHSDAGDQIIQQVASAPGDASVQTLCSALLVRSDNK